MNRILACLQKWQARLLLPLVMGVDGHNTDRPLLCIMALSHGVVALAHPRTHAYTQPVAARPNRRPPASSPWRRLDCLHATAAAVVVHRAKKVNANVPWHVTGPHKPLCIHDNGTHDVALPTLRGRCHDYLPRSRPDLHAPAGPETRHMPHPVPGTSRSPSHLIPFHRIRTTQDMAPRPLASPRRRHPPMANALCQNQPTHDF